MLRGAAGPKCPPSPPSRARVPTAPSGRTDAPQGCCAPHLDAVPPVLCAATCAARRAAHRSGLALLLPRSRRSLARSAQAGSVLCARIGGARLIAAVWHCCCRGAGGAWRALLAACCARGSAARGSSQRSGTAAAAEQEEPGALAQAGSVLCARIGGRAAHRSGLARRGCSLLLRCAAVI
jgi:hypothetical protein